MSIRLFLLAALLAAASSAARAQTPDAPPKLVVVVSIDQFRGDFVLRFQPYFSEYGFTRVQREGFNYPNGAYASANTETGPGHATLLTGSYAHRNGIVQNNWFDAAEGKDVYCCEDAATSPVMGSAAAGGDSVSPQRLLAKTVGHNLESASNGAAKTVSIAMKDRAAILMGGHKADVALWFNQASGRFVSSTHYGTALPAWVAHFNEEKSVDRWFKDDWKLLLPREKYEAACTVDDYPAERNGGFDSNTFPHRLGSRSPRPDRAYYSQLYTSPFANEVIVDLAGLAIEQEKMGTDATPDLLTLGFSCNDPIGHAFGPDSWEVMDATIRTDNALARLMDLLDKKVGKGEWTLFISSDHGVASFPEVMKERGQDAGRVSPRELKRGAEEYLAEKFGKPQSERGYLIGMDVPWVTLRPEAFDPAKPELKEQVAEAAAAWFSEQPGVGFSMPATKVLDEKTSPSKIVTALRLSHYPGRSGDIAFLIKPNWLLSDSNTGTTHGTAHHYDQSVVLMAVGKGIRQGASETVAQPPQIAPTAAKIAGVPAPEQCEVEPLAEALAP